MSRLRPHQEQQGFLTYAENTDNIDYLKLAYAQAMSIKLTQTHNKFAVVVDPVTKLKITDKQRQVFDYVIDAPATLSGSRPNKNFLSQWRMFWITPFKETIYVESDMLFTRNLDHWWNAFRIRDVCFSTGCKNYLQETVNPTKYRKVFVDNGLPDIYSGLMYFRYSEFAAAFFKKCLDIQNDWHDIELMILKTKIDASPDLVYSIAAHLVGKDNCTIPSMEFLNFVHMKPGVQGWTDNQPWTDYTMVEQDLPMIRINNINQYHPVHYYEKDFITDERIKAYERKLGIN